MARRSPSEPPFLANGQRRAPTPGPQASGSECVAAVDLGALADPARIAAVPVEQLPALLAHLAAVQAAVAARLAARGAADNLPHAGPDRLLTVDEAAQRLGVTKDWLRRRGSLPFVVKLSEGTVRYSAARIARFIAQHQAR
jgi:predicted DNA-binding transcriptional regulator AlpA